MPRGDGTGPSGQGPMTGRRMGYCAGFNSPGYMNSGFRRGLGLGRGFRWRARFFQSFIPPAMTKKQEKEILEEELKEIEAEKKEIEKRLKELK